MLTNIIKRVVAGGSLTSDEMATCIGFIMDGAAPPAQLGALLVALRMKGETVDELTGAASAMRAHMITLESPPGPVLDTCGTGGDAKGTFNISTAAAFVASAAGATVAKHGNRAVSSSSGSADVLSALGVNIYATQDVLQRCLRRLGISFLLAPIHHPAMQRVAAIRRELGIRTIFNLLGPLTNPAGARRQLLGVFDRVWLRPLAETLARLGSEHVWVVHSADGLDEISVCDVTHIVSWDGTAIVERTLTPEEVGLPRARPEDLRGGDPEENAEIMREIFAGKVAGPMSDVVALNAGAAIMLAGLAPDLPQGLRLAQQTLASGKTLDLLNHFVAASHTEV